MRSLHRLVLLAALVVPSEHAFAATQQVVDCDGYPCVNFAFGANVSRDGALFRSTFYNPPRLGAGLEPLGGGRLVVGAGGAEIPLEELENRRVVRHWPFASVEAKDRRLGDLSVDVEALAPNGYDDSFTGSLPVAMASVRLSNRGDESLTVELRYEPGDFLEADKEAIDTPTARGAKSGASFVAWASNAPSTREDAASLTAQRVTLAAGETVEARLVLGHWDDNYPSSARLTTPERLAEHVFRFWSELVEATRRLEARLPLTGDAELDEYLRWYTTAGVAMTKVLKDGTALTMGYHELNQRDSFWTSWAHLVLWPSVERRMIEESVWGQRPDGKVPTTILPVIEREEDVDINCFFILRGLRFARFHDDDEFGRRVLPSLKRAAEWLAGRDTEGFGLPRQTSFWNDWKDVPGMEGRAYSPYASMLYVAAMSRLADYCTHVQDADAERYAALAKRGEAALMRPADEGGLFNGRYFEHVWDSPPDDLNHVSEDQAVGVLYNVVPSSAQHAVLDSLAASTTQWGVRETFPFFEGDFGYGPGDYHNGGVWPYLNHVHAWALLENGRRKEAVELMKRVGRADLVAAGDYVPHEYLHGVSGEQSGVPMQGWNAAMFGALYFGFDNSRVVP
ncbi:GH116 family glycosyl hydrolase [Botrimarina sp.]|uniref:GH116 family glycosyl hydrolase n=1 Tax=Botrimarina sp. TaxID=2795802 RepID=UPI0032EAB33E